MSFTFKSDNLEKHRELSDKIKENLVVEDTTIKEKEEHSAYYKNLPDGITKKEVEAISKYNSKFITSAHLAVGELATDIFKGNKKAEEVNANIGYFGPQDNIEISIFREKTYQNHLAKDGNTEITKNLVMQTTVNSISNKGLGLKAAREAMSQEFANMFKK